MRMNPILVPFLGMLFLTLVVWFYMYYQRLTAIRQANIDP